MNRCGRDLLPDCEDASSNETYREQRDLGLDFFTITKTVYLNY